ncbi:MAG: choice-of-anchor D domain-containing protein [Planctomycetaceae bacterium]|nr:choice-of-anchor D domain-containing protein [Planctomycetaceae bacterium]
MFTKTKTVFLVAAVSYLLCGVTYCEDLYLNDGLSYQINSFVDGSLWVENASVALYAPAHITGFAVTGSGAVLDIFGGQIDYMLLVSTSDNRLPDGLVTIYGTDFTVDGVPVAPDTAELFLSNQTVSGFYEDGTPFSIVVDCAISGNASYLHYQTLKLGWTVAAPQVVASHTQYDFQQVDIGATGWGVVTISNTGSANLSVQSLSIAQNEPVQSGFTPLQVMPLTLEPGTSVDIEVYFAPAIEGCSEAMLTIESSDPDHSNLCVRLTGSGVLTALTPGQQGQAIAEFLQQAIDAGTIQGDGNGKSAANKTATFAKMIAAARQLIDAGYDDYALEAFKDIEKKCDGKKAPADFVKGPDAAALHAMVADVISQLQGS